MTEANLEGKAQRIAKILVVDDQEANLFAMKKVLASLEIEIFTAQSGNEALALLLHHEFAVAFLDVQMPEMDGFELATLMRDQEEMAQIPIIFVTAINKEERYVFKGYGSGAVDYLFKPIDAEVVRSKALIFSQLYQQRHDLEIEIEARKEMEAKNQELIQELQAALENIRTLSGILPICANCKKIRDDQGYWEQVEIYVSKHSEAQFTHGLCRDCMKELYPNLGKHKS